MAFCASSTRFDWADPCVRATWSAIAPAVLVAVFAIHRIPLPGPLKKVTGIFKSPFKRFLTLSEAEQLDTGEDGAGERNDERKKAPLWLTLVLSWTALLETVAWMVVAAYKLTIDDDVDVWEAWRAVLLAFSWLYASIKPIFKPKTTPHYDLFALYIVHILGAILVFGGVFFDHDVFGDPLPKKHVIALYALNLVAVASLLLITLSRPLAVPSAKVNKEEIGKTIAPEDYTSLWGWISFSWVGPLVKRGTYATLNEDDVEKLSITMQARPVFLKFSELNRKSLVWQIWAANSLDIL